MLAMTAVDMLGRTFLLSRGRVIAVPVSCQFKTVLDKP